MLLLFDACPAYPHGDLLFCQTLTPRAFQEEEEQQQQQVRLVGKG
jgi:hypothetical protein